MVSKQSFIFDFSIVPTFFDQWNLSFKLADMNGTSNNFQFVFCVDAPDNIRECLNEGGGLDLSAVTLYGGNNSNAGVVNCVLKWENKSISIPNDMTWNIGEEEVPLKAIFIRSRASGYVMAYCININDFIVTNKVIFDNGTTLWRVYDD